MLVFQSLSLMISFAALVVAILATAGKKDRD